MHRNRWNFNDPLPHISSFFLQLSHRVFLEVLVFYETGWKLQAKLTGCRSKVRNDNHFGALIFALDDGYDLHSIDRKSLCLCCWTISCLINQGGASNKTIYLGQSQPFPFEGDFFANYFVFLQILHLCQTNERMSKINYLILFKLTTSILNFGRMLAGRVQQKDQAVTKRMMSGD